MPGYSIDMSICTECGECWKHCPFSCVEKTDGVYVIGDGCTSCGVCAEICPVHAVVWQEAVHEAFDKTSWKNILVYLEYHHGKIHPIGIQLLGKAFELAASAGCDVYGVVIGEHAGEAKPQLLHYPLKSVFLYEAQEHFAADLYEQQFSDCIEKLHPSVVLIGGTAQGRSLAPCAATRFRTGLTADCTGLAIRDKDDLVQTRPAFGGNIMAQIITPNTRPQFATVRLNMMKSAEQREDASVVFIACSSEHPAKSALEILDAQTLFPEKDITKQKVLVAAGNGVRKREDLIMLEELAALLGGELASTRGLVEKGWIQSDRQIGLSGHTVRPKLLITCGVSGSVQFMAGMSGAENIIAINQDPEARIFQIAHYPVCGDLYEIVPELIRQLKAVNPKGGAS